jgi:hypothetical protein
MLAAALATTLILAVVVAFEANATGPRRCDACIALNPRQQQQRVTRVRKHDPHARVRGGVDDADTRGALVVELPLPQR